MIKILPHEKVDILSKYKKILDETDVVFYTGRVEKIMGPTIESSGPMVRYGELCKIKLARGSYLYCDVVGFVKNRVILMPLGDMAGIQPGAEVISAGSALMVPVGEALLGRVISGIGQPLDGKGQIFTDIKYPADGRVLPPLERALIDKPLSTGIRAIDGLNTVGRGQRIGIFSGSGVGKSTLLSMIARYTDADVNVIALIGERGKEVRDFVERELGPEGMKRTVVIAATSDQPPALRIRGAFLAHAVAEYFRDKGLSVNLLMDSVTRFAMALREVGQARGEMSATRGYPSSVFTIMPRLLERSGAHEGGGSITGFYTVLVEGDDMNEPISDAVRGILDGHLVLERRLANRGHYPAIDVLASISRCMKDVIDNEHAAAAMKFRELLAAYTEQEDTINLGAYARGANPVVDRAISMIDRINRFLKQGIHESEDYESVRKKLIELFADERKTVMSRETAPRPPAFARIVR
jgi:flagellum-specific ATP synthase